MRYVSPAWLFNGNLPATSDRKAIRLRRTQLLADLDLTGTTIEYHGEVLTKNDIINLFDELETENALEWHIAVSKDKTLFTFLDDIHFDSWAVEQHCVRYLNQPLYENEAFIRWISPYYYDSFMFYLEINCFKASNVHALIALLDNPLLMTPADQQKAWQAAVNLLKKPIARIERCGATAITENDLAKTATWMEEGFLQLIHLLPENYFALTRDKYATAIFDACERVRRKSPQYPQLTPIWMENAIRLADSPQLKKRLRDRYKKLSAPREQFSRLRKVPIRIWVMIILGLLFCYWIGRHR
jgi:hypothetical protein